MAPLRLTDRRLNIMNVGHLWNNALGAPSNYDDKVLRYNPLAYWPMTETSGTQITELVSSWHGTYTGVTLNGTGPDGRSCPFFDGSTSKADVSVAGFLTAMACREGAQAIWAKVYNAGVWTDNVQRYAWRLDKDISNRSDAFKSNTSSTVTGYYRAAGTLEQLDITPVSSTAWMFLALDYSQANDRIAFYQYIAGTQTGKVTSTSLGLYQAANVECLIGAGTSTPTLVFHGWLARAMAFSSEQGEAVWNALAIV